MALLLHDSENLASTPPLESSIPRPPSFHVYNSLLSAPFSVESVYLPYGLEDSTNSGPAEDGKHNRPTAPFPGFQSVNGVGIRPMYSAYLAATWICYIDPRVNPSQCINRDGFMKQPKEMIAHSLLSEMTNAAEAGLLPSNALGRSTVVMKGPHGSQRSRRIAATLLLPRAQSGREIANYNDIKFLNAFALIATATNKQCFAVDKDGVPQSVELQSGETPVALTEIVRMSVVAGGSAVASFAKTLGIANTPIFASDEWKQSQIVCISYVVGETVVHAPIVLPAVSGFVLSVARAVRAIQNAALRAQILSKGNLVLPHGFVSTDYIANIDDDDAEDSHFLRIQALKQGLFRRLHIQETKIDVPLDVVKQFDSDTTHCRPRFVRICSNTASIDRLQDESHCPGMIFTTNEDLTLEYLHRNRLQALPHPWTKVWPAYGLSPAVDEERRANVSVLWMRIETHSVGAQLNLFFPRVLMGNEVTEARDSRMFTVVPTLCPIESVLCSGNYVLPCTPQSMLPAGHGDMSSRLYKAFCRAIDESFDYLNSLKSPISMAMPSDVLEQAATSLETPTATATWTATTADDAFIGALFGSKIGHPANTCGDAYDLLQEHAASELAYSRSFHSLVAAGVSKLGAGISLHTLMDEAASALVERLSLREIENVDEYDGIDRKRPRTPNFPLGFIGSCRQDSTVSLSSNAPTQINANCLTPIPFRDSLQPYLCDNDNLRRLARIGGLVSYKLPGFDQGEGACVFPLDSESVEDLLDAIWLGYKVKLDVFRKDEDKLIAARIGVPHTETSTAPIDCFIDGFKFVYAAYYRTIYDTGVDVMDEFETYALFLPFEGTDAKLYAIRANSSFERVNTDKLLEPLKKTNKILFCITQLKQDTNIFSSPTEVRLNVWRSVPGM